MSCWELVTGYLCGPVERTEPGVLKPNWATETEGGGRYGADGKFISHKSYKS